MKLSTALVAAFAASVASAAKFVDVHLQPEDASKFILEIPASSLDKSFITHAIFNKGSVVNTGRGRKTKEVGKRGMMRSWDVEGVYDLAFHFELSEDKQFIHHVHEQHNIRTTDKQMEYAFHEGTFTGRVSRLPILHSSGDSFRVDAEALITSGFGVAYDVLLGDSYEIGLEETKAFDKNLNVVVNYDSQGWEDIQPTTFSVLFSIMELPQVPMTPRLADDRVGYFVTQTKDLGLHNGVFTGARDDKHQANDVDPVYNLVNRWRLEVDGEGNVVNPIKFYIDYSVPEIWRPYFKEGVDMWAPAFEKLGFKNAIYGVLPGDNEWPKDYQVGDLRYNTVAFSVYGEGGAIAYGPSIVDLRSGEIVSANVVFSSARANLWATRIPAEVDPIHHVGDDDTKHHGSYSHRPDCKHEHLFTQMQNMEVAGLAKGGVVPKEVVGAGYRNVMAHEIGHTIGLRHNFVGSLTFTPEQLKDPEFTKANGLTSTVMEYLPLNLWSEMTDDDLMKNTWFAEKLGEYDMAAIEYGYKPLEGEKYGVKHPQLTEMAKRAPDFATDEEKNLNMGPYAVTRDLSSDPAAFYIDRINLMKKLKANLIERCVKDKESFTAAFLGQRRLLGMLDGAAGGLARYIGAARTYHSHRDEIHPEGNGMEYASMEDQVRAIMAILEIIVGDGLYPQPSDFVNFIDEFKQDSPYAVIPADVDSKINSLRKNAMAQLLGEKNLMRVIQKASGATIGEILGLTTKTIWAKDIRPTHFLPVFSMHIAALQKLERASDVRLSTAAAYELAVIAVKVEKAKLQLCDMPTEQPTCMNAVALLAKL